MAEDQTFNIGDTVQVLRAARLPREETIHTGIIERVRCGVDGEVLYWIQGLATARTARTLRRYVDDRLTVSCLDCGGAVYVGESCPRCGLGSEWCDG